MNRDEFLQNILNKNILNIYVMHGEENYLKQLALNFAIEKLISPEFKDLNLTRFDSPSVKDIIDAAQTLPIMSKYRVIVVNSFNLFETNTKANESELESFIKFSQNISPDTVLFICVDKLDSRKKASKIFKDNLVGFNSFTDYEAQKWLINEAKKDKKILSKENAQKLIFICGQDASTLRNELDKLIAYNLDKDEIDKDSIDSISSDSVSYSTFNMTDALLEGNIERAFSILKRLIKNGENEYMLFAMMQREMRISYYIKALLIEGKTVQDISKICNIMAFAVSKRSQILKKYKFNNIKEAYRYCIDSEFAIKEGKISQEGIAERTLAGIYLILDKSKNL